MEALFNIAWAVLGVLGLALGLWLRRRLAAGGKPALARDLILLSVIVFLLFPIISFSDDIGYFSYFFSRRRAPDSLFFVSSARRERQVPPLVILQVFAVLLAALGIASRQQTVLGTIALAQPAHAIRRKPVLSSLRAPPSSLF